MKNILFITTSNLPTNPRLFKEIILARECGYKVSCCLFDLGNHWSTELNNTLMAKYSDVSFYLISASRKPFFPWLFSSLISKLCAYIDVKNIRIMAYASNKRSWLLNRTLPSKKYDLIVAHNIGALYPAYYLAKKTKTKFMFDVEDYHPGEYIRQDAKNEKLRREFLMRTILPQTKFFTTASPLIERYTLDLLYQSEITIPPHKVILNSFPENEFQLPVKRKDEVLKLVWFSQKVSFGRGLEQLLEAMTLFFKESDSSSKIVLSIIGDLDSQFEQQVIQPFLISNTSGLFELNLIPPLSQPKLHAELAHHDVGLALEPGKDFNNNIAISNKILAYAQAGLFILATNTPAQKQFMEEDREGGIVCEQNPTDMKNALLHLVKQRNEIKEKSGRRYMKAKELAWEQKAKQLLQIWSNQ